MDEEENGIDIERAKQVEAAALNLENFEQEQGESAENTNIEAETEEAPVQQANSSNMMLYAHRVRSTLTVGA